VGITTAGKTGTTGDNKDRWFCGFTGYYTAAVWCGYDSPEVINLVNGGNPAAQLWKKVMEPLHRGKSNVSLYNRNAMTSVTVCKDSGLLATDACKNDVRNGSDQSRLADARVYPEDVPKKSCDKHVEVAYCEAGKGVATDYCKHFAEVDEKVKITNVGLVKMTQEHINDFIRAKKYNLDDVYLRDDYIYLVDKDGKDAVYKGLDGSLKQDVEAPYKVCTVHTQAAWEEYQQQNPTEPDNQDPTDPSGSGLSDFWNGLFGNG